MTDKNGKAELIVFDAKDLAEKGISPRSIKALTVLKTAVIPRDQVKTHLGKGGKTFSYVPHNLATETMNDALGMDWDWEILDYQLLPDHTAVARGKMTIRYEAKIFNLEGNAIGTEWRTRIVTEMGGSEVRGKEVPVFSNQILGACSRALLRCMFRAFNYGGQFYKEQEESLTVSQAWVTLHRYATEKKVTDEEVVEGLKKAGIKKEDLIDRFQDAWEVVRNITFEKEAPNPMK